MVADVVNLRQQRKRKVRALDAQQSAENRAKYGRPKAARLHEAAESERATKAHEGHRLRDRDKE